MEITLDYFSKGLSCSVKSTKETHALNKSAHFSYHTKSFTFTFLDNDCFMPLSLYH